MAAVLLRKATFRARRASSIRWALNTAASIYVNPAEMGAVLIFERTLFGFPTERDWLGIAFGRSLGRTSRAHARFFIKCAALPTMRRGSHALVALGSSPRAMTLCARARYWVKFAAGVILGLFRTYRAQRATPGGPAVLASTAIRIQDAVHAVGRLEGAFAAGHAAPETLASTPALKRSVP